MTGYATKNRHILMHISKVISSLLSQWQCFVCIHYSNFFHGKQALCAVQNTASDGRAPYVLVTSGISVFALQYLENKILLSFLSHYFAFLLFVLFECLVLY